MQCPLLDREDYEFIRRIEFKDRIILEQREIIKGLMSENKAYREAYWNYRAEQDKDDWGR